MPKRTTDLQGRFKGVGFIDKGVDGIQRWWLLMGAAYTFISTYAVKHSALLKEMTWLDAACLGFVCALVLTALTLGVFSIYRISRMPPIAIMDRKEFLDETISLADLVGAQEPVIFGKSFKRCVITGPGQINLGDHNDLVFCSTDALTNMVAVAPTANISGSIMVVKTGFDRCHFEGITFVGTAQTMAMVTPQMTICPLRDWKEKRWS